MNSFASWLDRPFRPARVSAPRRHGASVVTIRYSGSIARSAVKTLVVLLFLAFLSGIMGERPSQGLDANECVPAVASAVLPG